jgi:glycine oxidase
MERDDSGPAPAVPARLCAADLRAEAEDSDPARSRLGPDRGRCYAPRMSDVLIIGAGAAGLSVALAVARRGGSVTVLDRTGPGAGASSTAAGVLGVQGEIEADCPLGRLCVASLRRYPAWAADLTARTGIDVGLRASGGLWIAFDAAEVDGAAARAAWAAPLGMPVDRIDAAAARAIEPALAPDIAGAARFAGDARLDPPALVKALQVAAAREGVAIRAGALARRVLVEDGAAAGVLLEDGAVVRAGAVVLAAGTWSGLVEGAGLPATAVWPSRGQIVELLTEPPLLGSIVYAPGCYLSPRDDGRVLIGSTLERVGFRPGVTAGAVQALLAAAIRAVPALAEASVNRTWSCFRPATPDELPLLGPSPIARLFLATGHFRNGIVLAPITGEILAAAIAGDPPPVDVAPFAPARLAGA